MDRAKPKGPDYLIIDNLVEIFDTFEKANLVNARGTAEALSDEICRLDESIERCDYLVWLLNLDYYGGKILALSQALSQIYESMKEFRHQLNEISQVGSGDRTLRVDQEEVLLSRYNGASTFD